MNFSTKNNPTPRFRWIVGGPNWQVLRGRGPEAPLAHLRFEDGWSPRDKKNVNPHLLQYIQAFEWRSNANRICGIAPQTYAVLSRSMRK